MKNRMNLLSNTFVVLMSTTVFLHINALTTDTTKSSFSAAEKNKITEKHNLFRRVPDATNMRKIEWDTTLETVATNYAKKCVFDHNSARKTEAGTFSSVGENLFMQTGGFDEENTVQVWYNEVSQYKLNDNSCLTVCGHYTQVIWAETEKVGCGIRFCPTATIPNQEPMTNAYLVVCNYATSGNFIGQKPYIPGTKCSACPSNLSTCDNGLCSKTVVPTTTPSSQDKTTVKVKDSTDNNGATTPSSQDKTTVKVKDTTDNNGIIVKSSNLVWVTIFVTLVTLGFLL